jgi:hypothetical protein
MSDNMIIDKIITNIPNKPVTPNAASLVANFKFFNVLIITRYVAARVLKIS